MPQKSINRAAVKVLNERLARPDGPAAFNSGDERRFIKVLVGMADDEIRAWLPEDVIATAKDLAEQKELEVNGYEDSFKMVVSAVEDAAVTYGDRWWQQKVFEIAKEVHKTKEGFTRYFLVYEKYKGKKTTLYLGTDPEEATAEALPVDEDLLPIKMAGTIFMEYKDIPSDDTEGLMGDEVMGVWKKTPGGGKIPRSVWWYL